ncbi:hypothetical protein [Amycolatopsis sp. H20-H5]|uniref:hypothetical protein n=1 Tax=Amycolatopsis sp. H20-H5 TaxID=3046309 RepID=UPI002DBC6259|nr:hypothetical protein [Amycolatopsis sp. H20-H5]MEC3973876.1 hypothetical protein [Amycolatopsis sp. H20-H5]
MAAPAGVLTGGLVFYFGLWAAVLLAAVIPGVPPAGGWAVFVLGLALAAAMAAVAGTRTCRRVRRAFPVAAGAVR